MIMTPVLAAVVDITGGDEGGRVVIDPLMPMLMSAMYLVLVLLPIILILFLIFYKNKYRHLQILAAMEKGLPISDLIAKPRSREVNWVRSLSSGIGFLFVGLALTGIWMWMSMTRNVSVVWLVIPVVISGFGLIFLFRGILQRNYEKQKPKEIAAQS